MSINPCFMLNTGLVTRWGSFDKVITYKVANFERREALLTRLPCLLINMLTHPALRQHFRLDLTQASLLDRTTFYCWSRDIAQEAAMWSCCICRGYYLLLRYPRSLAHKGNYPVRSKVLEFPVISLEDRLSPSVNPWLLTNCSKCCAVDQISHVWGSCRAGSAQVFFLEWRFYVFLEC